MRWPALGVATLLPLLADHPAAQDLPHNGPRQSPPAWHALVHATAVPRAGEVIVDATVLIRDGEITAIGAGLAPPDGATQHDCTGLVVFPGLIDAHVAIDVGDPPPGVTRHAVPHVRAEVRAAASAGLDAKSRVDLRKLGFTVAGIAPRAGVLRGLGAAQLLRDDDPRRGDATAQAMLSPATHHSISLAPSGNGYPGSAMGTIALIRQSLAEVADLRAARAVGARTNPSAAIEALLGGATQAVVPMLFEAQDELELLRAAKLAAEFGLRARALASGHEFRRLDAVVATCLPLIVPIEWPEAPDVDSLADQDRVSLRELLTWEHAPSNPARLDAKGVTIALTTHRLRERSQFAARVKEAVAAGLPAVRALVALTTAPAELLGIGDRVGTLQVGKLANLVVVRGTDTSLPFADGNTIVATWVAGIEHPIAAQQLPVTGTFRWQAKLDTKELAGTLTLTDDGAKLKVGEVETAASNFERVGDRLNFLLAGESLGEKGTFLMSAQIVGAGTQATLRGQGLTARGNSFIWRALGAEALASAARTPGNPPPPAPAPFVGQPFGAFARSTPPARDSVLVEGATIWTSGPAGIIRDGALLIVDGKVTYVGPCAGTPTAEGVRRIDGRGKHVTPGLIDCHSHTGISGGVNEGTRAVTAQVRIGDVVNPDDVNFYRQLAGGLTAANLLHGSANPIGGQNAVVKLRWGCAHPDDMLLAGAPGGIKFALGENPKRIRESSPRYPRTRQGVEVILRDRFNAAREYAARLATWRKRDAAERLLHPAPARDLELEALAEVLAGTRLVHCHSYRQDEILMLCRLAQEFGFRIGTFQHVLEGYKVADAIRGAAIGASSFSDWWAYKFEVYDAVPHNGALMHHAGVNVSFNSDSSELARRMNTEAAKAVKYGDLDPAEALKFVTLNPAIQLGVASRVGSLEIGKDGDFAVWSGEPLRTTTRCEATFIDGAEMFSLAGDRTLREQVASERARLLQKLLAQPQRSSRRGDSKDNKDDEADGRAYGCGWCGCEELGR